MQKSKWFCLKICYWSKTTHMNMNKTGIFKFGSPWTGDTSLLISPSFSLLNGGSGLACVCTKKHDNLNKMHMHTFFDIRTTHLIIGGSQSHFFTTGKSVTPPSLSGQFVLKRWPLLTFAEYQHFCKSMPTTH